MTERIIRFNDAYINYDSSLPKKDSKVTEVFAKININNWEDKEEVIKYVSSMLEVYNCYIKAKVGSDF